RTKKMRKYLFALCLAVAGCADMGGTTTAQQGEITATSPFIVAALQDTHRPQADKDRDADRHPADVLAFARIRPGLKVADVGPGGGYYTRLFAVAVGNSGKVYAVGRPAPPNATQPPRINAVVPDYQNVVANFDGYQAWRVGEPLDVIFISQIYHDFHLTALNL